MPRPEGRVIGRRFRSLLPDGAVWCESSDRDEVIERSKGRGCTFHVLTTYAVTGPWEPMEVRGA